MKKILSVIAAFILIISLSINACAAEFEAELPAVYHNKCVLQEIATSVVTDSFEDVVCNVEISAVEIEGVYGPPSQAATSEITPRSYNSFTFDNLKGQDFTSNYYTHSLDNPGVAKLRVSTCSWLPARYEIVIGLYNISTGIIYGVQFSNTAVQNVNITTENCPAGDYYVIVQNNEASNLIISDGIISYNLY